ncbi:MAG TPA: 50S ribosomal protein L24 [Candidatus Paceibacterota bacterium]
MSKLKIKIRKGDNVVVLAGKDKGQKGKVLRVLPEMGKLIIEGMNIVNKRRRPKKSNEKGQTLKLALPLDVSNVALWCNSCGKGRRVGSRMEGGKKIRICVKCKGSI